MSYSAMQHPDGRWEIYYGLELLATIGCQQTCKSLILRLNTRNQKKLRQVGSRKIKKAKALAKA